MDRSLEVRKLPPVAAYKLAHILDLGQAWKQLMAVIPKNEDSDIPKYKVEHIRMVESAGEKLRRSCSEILLEEWGCSGRKRPTLAVLLDLLVKAGLFRAADYIATDLLKELPPIRPSQGPAALVDVSYEALEQLLPKVQITAACKQKCEEGNLSNINASHADSKLQKVGNRNSPCTNGADQLELFTELPHLAYLQLEEATCRFSDEPYIRGSETSEMIEGDLVGTGRKLGEGAYGKVYLGLTSISHRSKHKIWVAVKKLHEDPRNLEKQFRNEVEMLSRFKHPNLLPLLGYSHDGPSYCLVYEYMCNGSLLEKLACKDDAAVLSWIQRLNISLSIAKGIVYLHTALPQPLVHRDIKSANILLDNKLIPKLGDFGLVRLDESARSLSNTKSGQKGQSSAFLTTTVIGTSAYMAPEAFRGDVSVKLDTFSFGVVLLELLTSLPPYDSEREGCDLVTHVEEICVEDKIAPLLDSRAGDWGNEQTAGEALFNIAITCLDEKRKRPKMVDILTNLEVILSQNVTEN